MFGKSRHQKSPLGRTVDTEDILKIFKNLAKDAKKATEKESPVRHFVTHVVDRETKEFDTFILVGIERRVTPSEETPLGVEEVTLVSNCSMHHLELATRLLTERIEERKADLLKRVLQRS